MSCEAFTGAKEKTNNRRILVEAATQALTPTVYRKSTRLWGGCFLVQYLSKETYEYLYDAVCRLEQQRFSAEDQILTDATTYDHSETPSLESIIAICDTRNSSSRSEVPSSKPKNTYSLNAASVSAHQDPASSIKKRVLKHDYISSTHSASTASHSRKEKTARVANETFFNPTSPASVKVSSQTQVFSYLENIEGFRWGRTDRLKSVFGLSLGHAFLCYTGLLVVWGSWGMIWSLYMEAGVWNRVGRGGFAALNLSFGLLGVIGLSLKSVPCLALSRAVAQAHIMVCGVTLVIGVLNLSIGLMGYPTHYDVAQVVDLSTALAITICAAFFSVGMFKSILAVIAVGGSGFEKVSWLEILAERI